MQLLPREGQNLHVISKLNSHCWSENPLMPDIVHHRGLVAICSNTIAMTALPDLPNARVREQQQDM